jgi:hypothetical protein
MQDREFIIPKQPYDFDGREMREIAQRVDDGWRALLVVDSRDAVDALEAIRAAYRLGQEDAAQAAETPADDPAATRPQPVLDADDATPQIPAHLRLMKGADPNDERGRSEWQQVIHEANGLYPGLFGSPEDAGDWWAGGKYETYHDATVVFRDDSPTMLMTARTRRGDRILRQAAANLGITVAN